MKAITIKQPWASLIVEGMKDIENRTWQTKFRGRVLVHAALKPHYDIVNINNQVIYNYLKEKELLFKDDIDAFCAVGAIIGSVEIVDCVINHSSVWVEQSNTVSRVFYDPEIHISKDWLFDFNGNLVFKKDVIYNWVLANPIKFPEPIPCKGKLSFWDYPNILAEPEEKGGELFCHCQLPVKEENQVWLMIDHFRCHYCEGRWCH